MDRRQFLKMVGGGAAYAAMGPSGAWGATTVGGQTITPFVLMVYCSGGWDPTMVFDAKLDSTFRSREPGATQAVAPGTNLTYVDHPDRPAVKAFFDTRGRNAVVVNGLNVGSMVNRYQVRNALSAVPPGKIRPVDWLTYYAASLNPVLDIPHAVIDAPFIPGDFTAVATRLTTETIAQYGQPLAGAESLGDKGEKALAAFRLAMNTQLYDAATDTLDGEKYRALYYGAGREGLIEKRLAAALTALGDRGTDSDFVRNGKLAVELFAAGASQCATVQAGVDMAWDTRSNHFSRASVLFEDTFAGVNAIIDHAGKAGVGDRMIVLVMSEGGRNPLLNAQDGKGPWPFTSMLLYGPGLAGGTTVGLSDAALRGLPINPIFGDQTGTGVITLGVENVIAALYVKTNVTAKLILPDSKPLSLILASGVAPK